MKIQIPQILLIIFIIASVWLSLLVKNQKTETLRVSLELQETLQSNRDAVYRASLLKEAFEINLAHSALNINDNNLARNSEKSASLLLYLKAFSCSPCNLPLIRALIEDIKDKEHFIIVSHTSNQHFLSMVLSDVEMENDNIIVFTDKELYLNDTMEFDAEILFLNRNQITGIIPLDFLKEGSIFEWVVAFV